LQLLHKHRSPLWTPRRVPAEPVEIDWNHPLAGGMIGCYVPGSYYQLSDLTGIGPDLVANVNGAVATTPEGYGYSCNTGNALASSTTMPVEWQLTTGGTLFWRGICTGNASSGIDLLIWGNLQNSGFIPDGSTSPTFCYAIKIDTTTLLSFGYAAGTTRNTVFANSSYGVQTGFVTSVAATWTVGGAIAVYAWGGGTQGQISPTINTGTWSGAAPDYSQSPEPAIGCDPATGVTNSSGTITLSAYLYNRPLTAPQIVTLDSEPFCMLRPVMRSRRIGNFVAPPGYRRWNRTYLIR